MYQFKKETNLSEYDEFIETHGGQYIQSSRWQKVKTTWDCTFYSGFGENGERVCALLVMERKLPLAGKIWYIPAGPVCDVFDTTLMGELTEFLKVSSKKANVTAVIMDPDVSIRIDGQKQEKGVKFHNQMLSLGYTLNTNTANYTYKQPVQLFIPLKQDGKALTGDQILKKCDKGVRYSIRLGTSRGLVAKSFTIKDIEKDPSIMDDFVDVMNDTSSRDDFVARNGDYCKKLLKEFDGVSDLKIVYYDKDLDKRLENERQQKKVDAMAQMEGAHEKKQRQLKEIIDSVDKQSEHFKKRMKEADEYTEKTRFPVAGGLSIYYAKMGSCLFGGTKNVIRNETRSSHYLNYLRLLESIDRGCDVHDLGYVITKPPLPTDDGTLGELVPTDNFVGIYDFKKSFSANYHEFCGEYVLINKKQKYFAYSTLMPKVKHLMVGLIKIFRK